MDNWWYPKWIHLSICPNINLKLKKMLMYIHLRLVAYRSTLNWSDQPFFLRSKGKQFSAFYQFMPYHRTRCSQSFDLLNHISMLFWSYLLGKFLGGTIPRVRLLILQSILSRYVSWWSWWAKTFCMDFIIIGFPKETERLLSFITQRQSSSSACSSQTEIPKTVY